MTNPHITRIPNKKSSDYHSWELPQIDDSTNVLSSAEKEDRERRELARLRGNEIVGETISSDQYKKPMTAKQISELAESARKQGYQDGLNEGKEAGYKKGLESGEQKVLDAARAQIEREGDRLITLVNGLLDPFEKNTRYLENILFDTIKALTETVVRRELQTDSSHIRNLVKESIAALPSGSDDITIYLNPDDIALMDDFFLERAVQWKLNGDPSMLPGGCNVQTKESFVDFSVEKRLQQTLEKFSEGEFLGDSENERLDASDHELIKSNDEGSDAFEAGPDSELMTGEIKNESETDNLHHEGTRENLNVSDKQDIDDNESNPPIMNDGDEVD